METGPLFSAMQQHSYSQRASLESLSTDDMRYLLILMGTITIISFILVVSVVSILIAFIW